MSVAKHEFRHRLFILHTYDTKYNQGTFQCLLALDE